MEAKPDERRRAPRHAIRVEVRAGIGVAQGEMFFETLDVSTHGAFLISELLLDPGERLSIVIPDGDHGEVSIDATVARVSLPAYGGVSRSGMGIEFKKMTPDLLELIDRLAYEAVT